MFEYNPLPKTPVFNSGMQGVFKIFRSGSDDIRIRLKNAKEIEETIADFINKQSELCNDEKMLESLNKSIEIMNLAAQELKFTLTPLVAKYNPTSYESHFLPSLIGDEKEIDHVFIEPKYGVEGFYYRYFLYIPVPKDMLNLPDAKSLIESHWNLIYPKLKEFKKSDLVVQFEPICLMSRVYGWGGSWLAYSVAVIDRKDYWSLPLVRTHYNGCQPFLAVREGEFAILQNDKNEQSIKKVEEARKKIESRIRYHGNIEFEKRESIEVAPEWITAHSIKTNGVEGTFIHNSQDFGSKIGSASFNENLLSTDEILGFFKQKTMGEPHYIFKDEEIGAHKILREL